MLGGGRGGAAPKSGGSAIMKAFVGDDIDIAKEMTDLTVQERERIYNDVHGVTQDLEETPEMMQGCLTDFDATITSMPNKDRKAFNKACFLRPSLETDIKFKLQFIRADKYNARHAAQRMVSHFEEKLKLFGEDKLVKRITIDDLSELGLQVFQSGFLADCPVKDQRGRPICFFDDTKLEKLNHIPIEALLRCFWYQMMIRIRDDTIVQKRGMVGLCFNQEGLGLSTWSVMKVTEFGNRWMHMMRCLPFFYSSYHICYDDPRIEVSISVFRLVVGKEIRLRLRTHLGKSLLLLLLSLFVAMSV